MQPQIYRHTLPAAFYLLHSICRSLWYMIAPIAKLPEPNLTLVHSDADTAQLQQTELEADHTLD